MNRVSVVVAVRDGRPFLLRCLQSVLAQLSPGDQLLVGDDGSRDGTPELLSALSGRLHWVRKERAQGKAATLNTLLPLAEGEIIFELDTDDWLDPGALDHYRAALASLPGEVACVTGDRVYHYWGEGSTEYRWGQPDLERYQFLLGKQVPGPRVYRRSALIEVGGWPSDYPSNGRLYEDYALLLRLLDGYKLAYQPGFFYHVGVRRQGTTHRHRRCWGAISRYLANCALVRWGDQLRMMRETGGRRRLRPVRPETGPAFSLWRTDGSYVLPSLAYQTYTGWELATKAPDRPGLVRLDLSGELWLEPDALERLAQTLPPVGAFRAARIPVRWLEAGRKRALTDLGCFWERRVRGGGARGLVTLPLPPVATRIIDRRRPPGRRWPGQG
ncbi:MAG: glycosyltransferase family 2 protein [Bacillota bacterium]